MGRWLMAHCIPGAGAGPALVPGRRLERGEHGASQGWEGTAELRQGGGQLHRPRRSCGCPVWWQHIYFVFCFGSEYGEYSAARGHGVQAVSLLRAACLPLALHPSLRDGEAAGVTLHVTHQRAGGACGLQDPMWVSRWK